MTVDHDEGVVTFKAAGKKYSAVFGFKAMKSVEAHFAEPGEKKKPFFHAIAGIMPQMSPEDTKDRAKVIAASANISFTDLGTLLEFALLKHHPDVTETEVENVIDEIGLGEMSKVIGEALSVALANEEGDDGSPKNPPSRRKQPTG